MNLRWGAVTAPSTRWLLQLAQETPEDRPQWSNPRASSHAIDFDVFFARIKASEYAGYHV